MEFAIGVGSGQTPGDRGGVASLIDRSGTRVYVTSAGANPNLPPDEVTVVDARTAAVLARLDGGGETPIGVALAGGRRLLVTSFYTGDMRLVQAASGRVLAHGQAGNGTGALVVVDRHRARGRR